MYVYMVPYMIEINTRASVNMFYHYQRFHHRSSTFITRVSVATFVLQFGIRGASCNLHQPLLADGGGCERAVDEHKASTPYSLSNNHGIGKWVKLVNLERGPVFHFHDYGRKSTCSKTH